MAQPEESILDRHKDKQKGSKKKAKGSKKRKANKAVTGSDTDLKETGLESCIIREQSTNEQSCQPALPTTLDQGVSSMLAVTSTSMLVYAH